MSAAIISARKSRSASSQIMNRLVLPTILSSAAAVSAFTTVPYNHNTNLFDRSVTYRRLHTNSFLKAGVKRSFVSIRRRQTSAIQNANSNGVSSSISSTSLSSSDIHHMKLATQIARIGYGNTYPNPAVGCVLVRHSNGEPSSPPDSIIGSGFHPKAGMPHAEVFALLEASGHVDDGVDAARSVMSLTGKATTTPLTSKVLELLDTYKSPDGASKLFNHCLSDSLVTAYVTLEPCCHVGQTPPCALSLVAAGIKRVVVGFRDPNPRVDGGGIQILKDSGIDVHVMNPNDDASNDEREAAVECAKLVEYFVKRISPNNGFYTEMYDNMNGKKRVMLRTMALRKKTDGYMPSVEWSPEMGISIDDKKDVDFLHEINIDSRFLEAVDRALFDHELVLLRLNNVVNKKKGAKILGERVAEIMCAHLTQVLGHTALLYRPGVPPVLDLDELTRKDVD